MNIKKIKVMVMSKKEDTPTANIMIEGKEIE